MKRLGTLFLWFLSLITLASFLSAAATAPTLTVGDYRLVKIARVAPKLFDFSYKAEVTNRSTANLRNLTLTLSLAPPLRQMVQVVDGELHFGNVRARATVRSSDTFTLRRNNVPVPIGHEQLEHGLQWSVAANATPIANAGPDQTVARGSTVILDGSASTDPDGDPLTYHWSFVSKAAGSTADLANPTAVNPSFVADKPGSHTVQLIVNDGKVNSLPAQVVISTQNSPPVANAGPDQSAFVGTTVTLDCSGSTDVDGDALTYQWSWVFVPEGSLATLQNPTSVGPSFTVDKPGSYVAQLIVNDGRVDSIPATVTLSTQNSAPVANAGLGQTVFVGTTVTLDGSGSTDVDGDLLTYHWSLLTVPAGSAASLSDPTAVKPTFTVDKPGSYVAQIIVNDGKVDSIPATVTISTQNSAPVANTGLGQTVFVGTTVTLDGSGSTDVDGDLLTYHWSLLTVPAGSAASLSDPTAVKPTFTVDKPGSYVAQLIVNDARVDSIPATVTISTQNSPPVANAGPAQTVFVGTTVTLDGSGSTDADGDLLSYRWSLLTLPTDSTTTLQFTTSVMPSFTVDRPGSYVAQLIVNDGKVDSAPATVTISTQNSQPVANAGPDQLVGVGNPVSLDGRGSTDADGDSLSYAWALTSAPAGSSAALTEATAPVATLVPDVAGLYVVQLIVSDGKLQSEPATATVTAEATPPPANRPPVANAGPDQTVTVGQTAMLDGSASADPDGNTLTFRWTLSSKPAGSNAALSDPAAVKPTFAADQPGTYVAQLIVNDGMADSAPATMNVTAQGGAPIPPDPATIAPPVDPTVATTVFAATQFLYMGDNPIQTGVAPGTEVLAYLALDWVVLLSRSGVRAV